MRTTTKAMVRLTSRMNVYLNGAGGHPRPTLRMVSIMCRVNTNKRAMWQRAREASEHANKKHQHKVTQASNWQKNDKVAIVCRERWLPTKITGEDVATRTKVVEWSISDVGGAMPSNMTRLRVRAEGSCSAVYGHRMGLAPSMAHILPHGGCCYPHGRHPACYLPQHARVIQDVPM